VSPRPLKIFVTSFGSAGDINPFIPIAAALRDRGHEVTFVANAFFEKSVRAAGVPFVASGSAEEHTALLHHPRLLGKDGLRVLLETAAEAMRRVYALLARGYEPGRTVVLASSWSFGARVAQEKLGIPTATAHVPPVSAMSMTPFLTSQNA